MSRSSLPAPGHPLEGKVALVTGAGRGIGRAIAIGLAEAEGAAVMCSSRWLERSSETAKAISNAGGRSSAISADVTDAGALHTAFEQAAAGFGGVDIVFANAGMSPPAQPVADSDPMAWRQAMDTNVFGVYLTARTAIPWLRRRGGGKIIVVGSGMKQTVAAGHSAYASSKAAAWMLVRTLAVELQREHISVNELIPGPVKTAMTNFGEQRLPPGEWIKDPDDVVPLALFTATPPRGSRRSPPGTTPAAASTRSRTSRS